jgi:hypothetical protein
MQKDPLIAALVGALFLGSAAILVLGLRYNHQAGLNRQLQAQFMNIQNARATAVALANDAVEYSKRNPSIDPILQQAGLKPGGKPVAK